MKGMARNSLTISETQMVKGIAILFMLFHHLFNNIGRYEEFQLTGLIISQEINLAVAKDLKVCVAMFALLSGYGMTARRKEQSDGKCLTVKQCAFQITRQYLNLIKDTAFLLPILITLTLLFHFPRTPSVVWGGNDQGIWRQIGGAAANMTGTASFVGMQWFVKSWWYLKVAILFIILFPLLFAILHRFGAVFLLLGTMVILPYLFHLKTSNDNLWRYLPAFVLGMSMAKYDIPGRVRNEAAKSKTHYLLAGVLLLLALAGLTVLKHLYGQMYIIQSFQAGILVLLTSLFLSRIPGISWFLEIIGKNSKYIWLIHVYIYGQVIFRAVFSLRNIWLIWFVVLVLSLLASIMLKKLQTILYLSASWAIRKVHKKQHG